MAEERPASPERALEAAGTTKAQSFHELCSVADLFAGAKQPRGRNALHLALTANDSDAAARLIECGDAVLLNQQSIKGCTPLMLLAMGHCNEELIWRLLERRATASVTARSETRRTAADYAESKRSARVVEALRALELEEVHRTAQYRCPVCGDVVRKRPLLAFFWERADRGEEDNSLLRRFFSNDCYRKLLQPAFHQINEIRPIRKELSESESMLEALLRAQSAFCRNWHVVDLCCGKSITAALVSLRYPEVTVSAVDKLAPRFLPHFSAYGDCRVKYTQIDVLDESFILQLEQLVRQAHRPTALLGMHLCGKLSLRAIEAYQCIESVRTLVLSPCCLPPKSDGASPPHLYATKGSEEQYRLWALHLEATLLEALPTAVVTYETVPDILSPRNVVICASKTT